MLKSLWLRWQCWRYDICWRCGDPLVFDGVFFLKTCPLCALASKRIRASKEKSISAAVRAMRGKP